MATWAVQVKECKIFFHQSLLTGWLAGWLTNYLAVGIVNLVSNLIRPSRVKPWNEVGTSYHEWSDAHEGKTLCMFNRSTSTSVREGPQSFGVRGFNY